ncbi:MAG TPA: N-(5'-phosphoribosyl)anthranilate isomerase, partial [Caldimonas sp.]|nr:N-(5'-phosphoribosyl)anthranilate isomerase [Caldimonas sp.]
MTVRVKICGLTRVKDACAAIAAGADMIGLNFYPKTPRCIAIDRAREIRAAVGPRATIVGVFVNAPRDYIDERVRAAALDLLQFSGDESDAALSGWPLPTIATRRLKPGDTAA